MRVLVTGGAGFIGAYVSRALRERGDEVIVLDDFNSFLYDGKLKRDRAEKFLNDLEVVEGSILDKDLLSRIFEKKFDQVVHLAAHANPGFSVGKDEEYTEDNLVGTLRVLKAMKEAGVKRLVFAGSSSVYDDSQTPFSEDSYPLKPNSPYAASKAAGETYCRMYSRLHGFEVTVLRFFSVYGPWGRPDMAPTIFASKILNEEVISLNKEERKRDFTYIEDVVPAVLAATDTSFEFEIINLGRGEPTGLREFIGEVERATGKKARIEERENPPGEMEVTFAKIDKAQELLKYQPKVSVSEGVPMLVEWLREYGKF